MTVLILVLPWFVASEALDVLAAFDVLEVLVLLHAAARTHVSAAAAAAAATARDLFSTTILSPERLKTEAPASAGLHTYGGRSLVDPLVMCRRE